MPDPRKFMPLPTVAIIGRPNVGKSSLFNKLIGVPMSIVDPRAGVTRDRIFHDVHRDGCHFTLIDTGGIGIVDEAKLEQDVNLQIQRAIDNAERIIFVCDGRSGLHGEDKEIAKRLRPINDRVSLVINKVD
ncbi:MAG: 50S ribosome-binding GTPase, partial [Planctomycetes bacterium]|nr:50S ribosome-binding GTPase [Planctomycetota bacterium]